MSENEYITISSDGARLTLGPMFPSTVTVGEASITLKADGTWEGDRDAFLAAIAKAKMDSGAYTMPVLWLIAHALKGEQ